VNEPNRPVIELTIFFNGEQLTVIPLALPGIAPLEAGESPVRLALRLAGDAAALEAAGRRQRPRDFFYRFRAPEPTSPMPVGDSQPTCLNYTTFLGGSVTSFVYDAQGKRTQIADTTSPGTEPEAGGDEQSPARTHKDEPPPDEPNVVG
jgi:hypothetical protein